MKEILKKNHAITLVSLVVTIIILIILAGVSINLILGKNGIITMAKQAKENTELAKIEEETALNELYMQIEAEGGTTGDISYDAIAKLVEFKREIASAISDMGITTSEDSDATTMASNIRSISGASSADKVSYDNTNSGLTSTNVQGAIDEVNNGLMKLDTCDLLGSNASTTENTITANINNYKFLVLGEFSQSDNSSCTIVTIPVSLFKITKIFTSRYNGTGSTASTSFGAKATYISDNQFKLKILTAASGYEARLYGIK